MKHAVVYWNIPLFHLVAYNIVSLCQRDVGFSGKTAAVIRHALRLLEDDVLVTQTQGNDCEEICIEPKLVLPHVLNLAFYSNQVFELRRIFNLPSSIILCEFVQFYLSRISNKTAIIGSLFKGGRVENEREVRM